MNKNSKLNLKTWLLLIIPVFIYLTATIVVICCFWQKENYYMKYHLVYVLFPLALYFVSVIAIAKDNYLLSLIGNMAAFAINIILTLKYRMGFTLYSHPIGSSWISIQYCLFHFFSLGIIISVCICYRLLCWSKDKLKNDIVIRALASAFFSIAFVVLMTIMNNVTAIPRISNYFLPVSGDIFVYELTAVVCACIMVATAFGNTNKLISFIYTTISAICLPIGIIAYYFTSLLLPFQYSNNIRFESFNYTITSPLYFLGLFFGVTTRIRIDINKQYNEE